MAKATWYGSSPAGNVPVPVMRPTPATQKMIANMRSWSGGWNANARKLHGQLLYNMGLMVATIARAAMMGAGYGREISDAWPKARESTRAMRFVNTRSDLAMRETGLIAKSIVVKLLHGSMAVAVGVPNGLRRSRDGKSEFLYKILDSLERDVDVTVTAKMKGHFWKLFVHAANKADLFAAAGDTTPSGKYIGNAAKANKKAMMYYRMANMKEGTILHRPGRPVFEPAAKLALRQYDKLMPEYGRAFADMWVLGKAPSWTGITVGAPTGAPAGGE